MHPYHTGYGNTRNHFKANSKLKIDGLDFGVNRQGIGFHDQKPFNRNFIN